MVGRAFKKYEGKTHARLQRGKKDEILTSEMINNNQRTANKSLLFLVSSPIKFGLEFTSKIHIKIFYTGLHSRLTCCYYKLKHYSTKYKLRIISDVKFHFRIL